ncbi:MAG: alpha/beta fold hydrolase [Candidatus Levybacteria bacterium]|nr:alpha/beta fold hydrolase [Candidatus Levybacteria bacterium]
MKSKVFIFHGTGGHPKENWFPWIKEKLQAKGCQVIVLQFPTSTGQSVGDWFRVLDEQEVKIDENTILIGHSLGGIFLLRVLERLQKPVKAAFFVGTPVGVRPIKNWESDERFSGFDFDWKKIRSNAKHFVVFHSDNDPYVSLENGEKLAKELGTDLTFIPNAGHFNATAGYTKFNQLLEGIEKILVV